MRALRYASMRKSSGKKTESKRKENGKALLGFHKLFWCGPHPRRDGIKDIAPNLARFPEPPKGSICSSNLVSKRGLAHYLRFDIGFHAARSDLACHTRRQSLFGPGLDPRNHIDRSTGILRLLRARFQLLQFFGARPAHSFFHKRLKDLLDRRTTRSLVPAIQALRFTFPYQSDVVADLSLE